MCIPQSSMMFFPPIETKRQERPTSCPAPNGVTIMFWEEEDEEEVEVEVVEDIVEIRGEGI